MAVEQQISEFEHQVGQITAGEEPLVLGHELAQIKAGRVSARERVDYWISVGLVDMVGRLIAFVPEEDRAGCLAAAFERRAESDKSVAESRGDTGSGRWRLRERERHLEIAGRIRRGDSAILLKE